MKIRLFAATLATVAGCGSSKPVATTTPPTAESPAVAAAAPAEPAKPKPEIGTWGFDTAGMDTTVAPGESFFRYADGTWLKTTEIPPDKADYGSFTSLADRSEQRTRQILETASGAPGSDAQRIGDYYKTFMDEAAIEAKGLAPIHDQLDHIAKIKDAAGVVRELAARSRRLGDSPFIVYVAQDERAPENYLATITEGGLGLPDRDMYDVKSKQFAPMRDAYPKYIAQMLTLCGVATGKAADQRAAAVYALEDKIAKTHWTRI